MSLSNEYTDNFFIGESLILDAHLRLLFRAFHYETPCTTLFQPKFACCALTDRDSSQQDLYIMTLVFPSKVPVFGFARTKTPATTQLVKKNYEVALSCLLTRGGQFRKFGVS